MNFNDGFTHFLNIYDSFTGCVWFYFLSVVTQSFDLSVLLLISSQSQPQNLSSQISYYISALLQSSKQSPGFDFLALLGVTAGHS